MTNLWVSADQVWAAGRIYLICGWTNQIRYSRPTALVVFGVYTSVTIKTRIFHSANASVVFEYDLRNRTGYLEYPLLHLSDSWTLALYTQFPAGLAIQNHWKHDKASGCVVELKQRRGTIQKSLQIPENHTLLDPILYKRMD